MWSVAGLFDTASRHIDPMEVGDRPNEILGHQFTWRLCDLCGLCCRHFAVVEEHSLGRPALEPDEETSGADDG
jgi:hypothetical protein